MLTRKQLRSLHGKGLPLHILEQDYIQALYLKELYLHTEDMVFKGGTYLKHAYGLDRFSEDLDFTRLGSANPIPAFKTATSRLNAYGIEAGIEKIGEEDSSLRVILRYRGPLYDGIERSIGAIHIEVSIREDIILEPKWTRLFFEYPETRVVNVLGLRKEEAFAEKLRALSTRIRGRDLYDVWFLIKQKVKIEKSIFERKMGFLNQEPVVNIRISKREWERDLEASVINPPDYEQVVDEVASQLASEGLEVLMD